MGLPGEDAETLARVLTGLKDPRLADDPLVLHALEAGADLVEEALGHAPTSAGTHPFLSYLSRGSVVRAIRNAGSGSVQDHHLRYRWDPHNGYLHDLVAYMSIRRRSRSFAERNADWITKIVKSQGRPAEAIRRVTNANQRQVLANPLFRMHLLVAAILGSPTVGGTAPDLYAEIDNAWLPIIDAVIKQHRRQLRPDVSLRDIVEILVAVGEGIALRELAGPGDSGRRERRVTLQGTTALALMYACTVPDDDPTAFGLDTLFDDRAQP
ncbi:MAG TPA: hypothetical protein VG188_05590 [Solirubrobacteraceae bacterium]|jgi:hypothetical protein|nr:hypothetical protein [Solirubrobacteraceae bacterium]